MKGIAWGQSGPVGFSPAGQKYECFKIATHNGCADFRLTGSRVPSERAGSVPHWAAWAFPLIEAACRADAWGPLPAKSITKLGYRRLRKLCEPCCDEHRFVFRGEVYAGCLFGELLRYGKMQSEKLGDWRIITAALTILSGTTVPCIVLRDSNGSRFGVLASMYGVPADGLPVLEAT